MCSSIFTSLVMQINVRVCSSEITVLLGEYFKCHVKCGNQTQVTGEDS